ncbi:MAG: hypothetical protein IV093_22675 [Rubrivivax sp.]|nr:hypothetical protein [Rubrivivax sp.]
MTPQDRLAASRAAMARTLAPPTPRDTSLADGAPQALQHPWAMVGAAAVAGAAVVALRPWRWLPSTPVLVALVARAAWRSWNQAPQR